MEIESIDDEEVSKIAFTAECSSEVTARLPDRCRSWAMTRSAVRQDAEHPVFELLRQTKETRGWQSAKSTSASLMSLRWNVGCRNCAYPQELLLRFDRCVRIRQIQLLCHEFKVRVCKCRRSWRHAIADFVENRAERGDGCSAGRRGRPRVDEARKSVVRRQRAKPISGPRAQERARDGGGRCVEASALRLPRKQTQRGPPSLSTHSVDDGGRRSPCRSASSL